MYDNQLIKELKKNCKKNISFIDEVANVLDINYDASYRRINGRTSISLSESIILAKHFNVSLNSLYKIGDKKKLTITRTTQVTSITTLISYFENLNSTLKPLSNNNNATIFYNGNELPIFHLLNDNVLFRFKLFVWLQVLEKNRAFKKVKFENFKFPAKLINNALETGKYYQSIKVSEMWSFGIIDSTVNQIKYFYEAQLISFKTAVIICNDLKNTFKSIEETTHTGKRNSGTPFELYHNELTTLNNAILLKVDTNKILFVPHSLLNYYRIDNNQICDEMDDFISEQRYLSRQITHSGIKDIILFFKKEYEKIDKLLKYLDLMNRFPVH